MKEYFSKVLNSILIILEFKETRTDFFFFSFPMCPIGLVGNGSYVEKGFEASFHLRKEN